MAPWTSGYIRLRIINPPGTARSGGNPQSPGRWRRIHAKLRPLAAGGPPQRKGCAAASLIRGGNAMEGTIANIVVQLIAGAIGGTAAGSALKDLSMGKAGDAISGA